MSLENCSKVMFQQSDCLNKPRLQHVPGKLCSYIFVYNIIVCMYIVIMYMQCTLCGANQRQCHVCSHSTQVSSVLVDQTTCGSLHTTMLYPQRLQLSNVDHGPNYHKFV